MTDDVLLAVDAGTSRVKAVAFTLEGAELATATRETETLRPAPSQAEQGMEAVWERTAAALAELTGDLPEGATPVGVGVTGQGDGLWAVTADGEPVRNAVLWSDSRAAGILEGWEDSGTMAAVVEQCGSAPYPGMSLPLLAWLARERPAEFERVDTVLSCKDWLKYRLTGERTLDPSEATVPYLDRTTGEYEPAVFDRVGLPEAADVLPRLAGPTEVIGHVTEAAADATGLEAGLPVVGGLFDVPASALGSGAAAPGEAAVTLGTSLTHQVLVEGPQEAASGIGMALGLGELWTYAIGSNAGTPGLEWVADTVADEPVEALASLAEPVPVGSEGVLYHPYLSSTGERGPFVDPDARGQFVGLTTEHETAHLVRATYEGLSLAVRDCVEHLPTAVSELRLSGGGSRSPFWCQLIADCLGQPTAVPAGSEVGARGAAVLLALGLGEYPSIEAAVDEMVTIERRYSPREAHVPQYDRLYELYVDVRTGMEPLWSQRAETYRELGTDPES